MSGLPIKAGTAELLTTDEAVTLAAHEDVIRHNLATFTDVGNALCAIRDARLYRATHGTFEDYCREKWGMGKAYAFRMIAAAEVVRNVSPMGDKPASERQARPLTRLPPAQQPLAWQAATAAAAADDRPVTAKDVARAVSSIVRESNPQPSVAPPAPAPIAHTTDPEKQPCPFCGSASLAVYYRDKPGRFFVSCRDCGAHGPEVCGRGHDRRVEAVELWNKAVRAAP